MKKILLLSILLLCFSCSKDESSIEDKQEKIPEIFALSTLVSPSEGGSITGGEETYKDGEEVTLTAASSEDYEFKEWQGDISGSENPINFIMSSDKEVLAVFEKKVYSLNFDIIGKWYIQNSNRNNTSTVNKKMNKQSEGSSCSIISIEFLEDGTYILITSEGENEGEYIVTGPNMIDLGEGVLKNLNLSEEGILYFNLNWRDCSSEGTATLSEINISTKAIENVTYNSVKSGGVIIDDGGSTIISKGLCWSTSPSPTLNDNKLENGSEGYEFSSQINGLQEDTTYYLRAYATNENGTTYGDEKTFRTPTPTHKVELKITGNNNSFCGDLAEWFYYEVHYKFDDNDVILDGGEGLQERSFNHVKNGKIENNLEVIIHLGRFNPDNPSEQFLGSFLDKISVVITNLETNEEVVNTSLQDLFICTDVAYKNIVNFNPVDNSYTIERLTHGF